MAQWERICLPMTQVWFLAGEDPLVKEMATHSSILAGEPHGQRSLAGYSPWGHKRVGLDWATKTTTRDDLKGTGGGTSLVVQWVRLQTPNAGCPGLIPGQRTRSHVPQLRPTAAIYVGSMQILHHIIWETWAFLDFGVLGDSGTNPLRIPRGNCTQYHGTGYCAGKQECFLSKTKGSLVKRTQGSFGREFHGLKLR